MIFSEAGHIFLKRYNQDNGTDYNAKGFFEDVFYPLFFNVGKHNKKLAPSIANSPFDNNKPKNGDVLKTFQERVDESDHYSGSYLVGNPAKDYAGNEESTFDGMISWDFPDPRVSSNSDDVYLSWVGLCFSISIGGKYVLFNDPDLFMLLFKGFKYYRKFVEDGYLAGKNVRGWNLIWIDHYVDGRNDDEIFNGYNEKFLIKSKSNTDKGLMLGEKKWGWAYHVLSKYYGNKTKTGVVFSLGMSNSKNKTLGYVNFKFRDVKEILLDEEDDEAQKEMQTYKELYGGEKKGEIGLNKSFFDLIFNFYDTIDKVYTHMGSVGLKGLDTGRFLDKVKDITQLGRAHIKLLLINICKTETKEDMKNTEEHTKKLAELLREYSDNGSNNERQNVVVHKLFNFKNRKNRLNFIECLNDNLIDVKDKPFVNGDMSHKKDEMNSVVEFINNEVDQFRPFMEMVRYYYYMS